MHFGKSETNVLTTGGTGVIDMRVCRHGSGNVTHLLLDVFTYSFLDGLCPCERLYCAFYFANNAKLWGRKVA
jgi:hypothetical protein